MSKLTDDFNVVTPAPVKQDKLNLLLMSNGALADKRNETIAELYGASPENPKTIIFVPYALKDCDAVTDRVAKNLAPLGITVIGAHTVEDPVALLDTVDGVYVGGGNTFRLVDTMQKNGLMDAIRDKVEGGMPYMGASAGINVAGPTVMTTNDMPIVQPKTLNSMALVPFQINPHFAEGKFFYEEEGKIVPYQGETRSQRLMQFHEENTTPIVGLKEGTALRIRGEQIELLGNKTAILFEAGKQPQEVNDGKDLNFLMTPAADKPATTPKIAPKGPQP